jgi:hypothetical protein
VGVRAECLSKYVSELVLGANSVRYDRASALVFSSEMILDINMFCPLVELRVLYQFLRCRVVNK